MKKQFLGEVETHKLYRFKDLSFGKLCSVNRDIREAHVRKILRGLESGTWHRLGVIFVDPETREIVDGNHRYIALERYLEKYGSFDGHEIDVIYYERPEGESLADAVKFYNSDRQAMSSKDYAKVSENNGNQAIPLIREFGQTHTLTQKINKKGEVTGFSERYAYSFIYGKNVSKEVKAGTIEIDKTQLKHADVLHKEVDQMINACDLKVSYWLEPFVQAWFEVRKNRLFLNQFKKVTFDEYCDYVVEASHGWSLDKTTKSDWTRRFQDALTDAIE